MLFWWSIFPLVWNSAGEEVEMGDHIYLISVPPAHVSKKKSKLTKTDNLFIYL